MVPLPPAGVGGGILRVHTRHCRLYNMQGRLSERVSMIFAVAPLFLAVQEIPPVSTVHKPGLFFTLHPAYTQKTHSSNRDKITLQSELI